MIEVFGPVTDLTVIAILLSFGMQVMQRKFIDRKAMKENQGLMKKKQARMKEIMHKEDKNSKKEIKQLETETMELLNAMMQGSMKHMMVSMIVIIPLWWFLGSNYQGIDFALPMALPFWSAFSWFEPASWITFKFFEMTNWIGWYVMISIIVNLLFNVILNLIERINKGETHVSTK